MREEILQFTKDDSVGLRKDMSTTFGNLAWHQLLLKEFDHAIKSAQDGLTIFPGNDWIYTNLALGYLLTRKFDEAEKIYMTYKDAIYSDGRKSFREGFLHDLEDMEADGIISPIHHDIYEYVNKIRRILKK